MKYKTTQRTIRANYPVIISVPYCALQTLLNYNSPEAYTVRREGWAADIYGMSGGVAIVTGYAPFGTVKPSHDIMERYEDEARKVCTNVFDYNGRVRGLEELQRAFISECIEQK